MHETNVYRTILGGVLRGFRTPLVDFDARSLIFWHLKMGTFGESAHFQVPKNETLSAEINQRSPKTSRNTPQNVAVDICFMHLAYSGEY